MNGWVIGWIIGGVVVVAVVTLLLVAIVLSSRIAGRAESITGNLRSARDATEPLTRLRDSTSAANRTVAAMRHLGDDLARKG